jgi:hypothetical protein
MSSCRDANILLRLGPWNDLFTPRPASATHSLKRVLASILSIQRASCATMTPVCRTSHPNPLEVAYGTLRISQAGRYHRRGRRIHRPDRSIGSDARQSHRPPYAGLDRRAALDHRLRRDCGDEQGGRRGLQHRSPSRRPRHQLLRYRAQHGNAQERLGRLWSPIAPSASWHARPRAA